ncbi:glycosyltransferase family 2 protein [Jidongwangia harbinensis]|uniref:glycosyltransferase family 2 protein n=1 Tax=Jidongwangia harbinensis TaxID=2878561 RepID=UPI001CD93EAC|nr:glycosyltransferase family 2 protein [Jidongwangia harbinensis]MCA2211325.1 glycosyltransferase family 2 protein [Jidongwangia harbinensis]
MSGPTGVSVVVICRDEARYIDGCLTAIGRAAAARTVPVEVLVVDGASADDTVHRAGTWSRRTGAPVPVRVVRCHRPGYGHQRNAGVAAARYPWVAFLSADVRVGPDWLTEVAAAVEQPVDLVLGRFDLVTPPGRRPWLATLVPTLYPTCDDGVVARCSTVHLVARRAALPPGPFDEDLAACEDKELAYRLRRSGRFRGATTLGHRPAHLAREGVGAFLTKVAAEARALGQLDRRTRGAFPDCFGWRRRAFRTAGVTAIAAVAVAARPRSRFVPVLAATAVLATGGRHATGWRRRDPDRPVLPQAALHAAAMLTISAGYLTGRFAPRTARRSANRRRAGGTDAPREGLLDTGADLRGEPRGDPAAPVPRPAGGDPAGAGVRAA